MSKLDRLIEQHEDLDEGSNGELYQFFNKEKFADALIEAVKEQLKTYNAPGVVLGQIDLAYHAIKGEQK